MCSLLNQQRWDSHHGLGFMNDLEKILEVIYSVYFGHTAGEGQSQDVNPLSVTLQSPHECSYAICLLEYLSACHKVFQYSFLIGFFLGLGQWPVVPNYAQVSILLAFPVDQACPSLGCEGISCSLELIAQVKVVHLYSMTATPRQFEQWHTVS